MNQSLFKSTLLFFLISSVLFSCKKENELEEAKYPYEKLYAEWKYFYRAVYDLETGAPLSDEENISNWSWANIIFFENGTGTESYLADFTWKTTTHPDRLFIWSNEPYFKPVFLSDSVLILVPDPSTFEPNDNPWKGYKLHKVADLKDK